MVVVFHLAATLLGDCVISQMIPVVSSLKMFVASFTSLFENERDTAVNFRQSRSNFPERHEKVPEIYRLFPTPSSSHFYAQEKILA